MNAIKLITPLKKYTPKKIRFDLLVPLVELVSSGYVVASITKG